MEEPIDEMDGVRYIEEAEGGIAENESWAMGGRWIIEPGSLAMLAMSDPIEGEQRTSSGRDGS
jgi:hypothetical protein